MIAAIIGLAFGIGWNVARFIDHYDQLLWEGSVSELSGSHCAAIAAATGTAKTPQAAECEASQSGPKGIAQ